MMLAEGKTKNADRPLEDSRGWLELLFITL